jgi:hypothetical protein
MAQAVKQLISGETRVVVQSAFHALEQAILIRNAWTLEDLLPLQDTVSDMLQPMLKSWLSANLPAMVERLVRAEIERTARTRAALDLARRQS